MEGKARGISSPLASKYGKLPLVASKSSSTRCVCTYVWWWYTCTYHWSVVAVDCSLVLLQQARSELVKPIK